MTDPETRHSRGLLVVIVLAVIFLAILTMIVLKAGGKKSLPVVQTETLTVLPMRVRIRTEPNARAAVVATATTGEQLQMVEDQGQWVQVRTGDGLTGWAERVNLERTAERERRLARFQAIRKLPALAGEATGRTQLYAGPGIFYPIVGELAGGSQVKVYTRDHDFYAVDHGDAIAYADVDKIDVTASGSPQLNVATSTSLAATDTTTTAPPPSEVPQTASEAPIEPPAPAPVEERTGVYTAVPPGGTQPEEIDRVVPQYPMAARAANVGGSVVIRGIVRRDGTIDDVEIIKDLPYGLGESARRAVQRWRFRPATYRGEPIDVYYTVTVNFRLR